MMKLTLFQPNWKREFSRQHLCRKLKFFEAGNLLSNSMGLCSLTGCQSEIGHSNDTSETERKSFNILVSQYWYYFPSDTSFGSITIEHRNVLRICAVGVFASGLHISTFRAFENILEQRAQRDEIIIVSPSNAVKVDRL